MNRLVAKLNRLLLCLFVAASPLAGVGLFYTDGVSAAALNDRSMQLSNTIPGQTSSYVITFTMPTSGPFGSALIEFCDGTPLFTEICIPPAGFSLSGATLASQSGETGFAIDTSSTANTLLLSRTPADPTAGGVTVRYTLDNVHNASFKGTQYVRYRTFATSDGSGSDTDRGGLAFTLDPQVNVSTEVPPFLEMCIGLTIDGIDCQTAQGNYINMGNFTTSSTGHGQTQIVIGTNAKNGYAVYMSGQPLTSGNNIIPSLTAPTASRQGISQFGINLRSNTNPQQGIDPSGGGNGIPANDYNQPNRYVYRSGDVIASYDQPEDYRKYTVSYMVNISREQPGGVYSSSFAYTGLGNF